jgi:hypothetical protein
MAGATAHSLCEPAHSSGPRSGSLARRSGRAEDIQQASPLDLLPSPKPRSDHQAGIPGSYDSSCFRGPEGLKSGLECEP